jgi:PKD repeat protein
VTSWLWDFGDGTTSTGHAPVHTYTHDGTYHVCLTIQTSTGCSDTQCQDITVNQVASPCHAAFSSVQTVNTLIVKFSEVSSGATPTTSWLWDFGDGTTSTDHSPAHTYAHSGNYHVCLTIQTATGCSDTYCHDITVAAVQPPPCHAVFTYHQTSTSPLSVNFIQVTASTNITSTSLWDFGDGTTSTEHNPTHVYNHAGTYYVCLTVANANGCTSTYCQHITVSNPGPTACFAKFTFHAASAAASEVYFTNASVGTTPHTVYNWDFGDGTTSTDENPSHVFAHAGQFNVCLFIADSTTGCASHFCLQVNHVFFNAPTVANSALAPIKGAGMSDAIDHFVVAYPNPANAFTTLQYELTSDTDVTIEVFDQSGSRTGQMTHENQSKGPHSQQIDIDSRRSGFYLVKLTAGGHTYFEKISAIR